MAEAANPYAPPSAQLAAPGGARSPFFAVGQVKFSVLAGLTFSIYAQIWAYYSWRAIRERTGERLSPLARAFFAPITNFALFARLDREARAAQLRGFPALLTALAYLLANFAFLLRQPWGTLIPLAAFLAFVPANGAALRINRALAPDAPDLAPWTALNAVMAVLFGLLFLLVIIALAIGVVLGIE